MRPDTSCFTRFWCEVKFRTVCSSHQSVSCSHIVFHSTNNSGYAQHHTHTSRLVMMHLKHTIYSRFAIIKMPSQKLSPIQQQPEIQGHAAFQDSNDNSGILIPRFQLSSHPPAFRQFQNWCQVLWNVQESKNFLWCSYTEKKPDKTHSDLVALWIALWHAFCNCTIHH